MGMYTQGAGVVAAMIGYKLFRKRQDGTYGPLFINRRQRLTAGVTYIAEDHPTKGYAHRPGWHVCERPVAPHLSERGRVWCRVRFEPRESIQRPESQGGRWWLGESLEILEEVRRGK